jgi:hypothetical protein
VSNSITSTVNLACTSKFRNFMTRNIALDLAQDKNSWKRNCTYHKNGRIALVQLQICNKCLQPKAKLLIKPGTEAPALNGSETGLEIWPSDSDILVLA